MTQATHFPTHSGAEPAPAGAAAPEIERLLTWENGLILLAFSLALFMRLLNLGTAPLTDREAAWALQALSTASGGAAETTFGPQPAYLFLTSLIFALFGSSEFLARLVPALVGAGLVFAPVILLRGASASTTRLAMLVAAFGLALDPGLITVSRQAGGPMPAIAFSVLALALWHTRRLPVLAGILAGLALLSGPAVLFGMLSLLLAAGVLWLLARFTSPDEQPDRKPGSANGETSEYLRRAGLAGGLTILLTGTLLLRAPHGLGAWLQTLPDFLDSWLPPAVENIASTASPLTLLAALLIFQPFALLFAGVAVVRRSDQAQHAPGVGVLISAALAWVCASLALALVYPGRQVSDLAWTLVPLWFLAAFGLAPYLPGAETWDDPYAPPVDRKIALLGALMVLILAGLFWNTMIAVAQINAVPGVSWNLIRLAVLAGIIFLGALAILLIALGWSWETGRNALVWGLCAVFLVYALNLTWSAAQLRPNQPQELWAAPPAAGQARLLEATLRELSNRSAGLPVNLEVYATVDSPALRWSLRNFRDARFVNELPPGQKPAIVITKAPAAAPPPGGAVQSAPLLALADAYRGQDFVWWVTPGWQGFLPPDLVQWLAFRQAPLTQQHLILWARSDIASGQTP